MNGFRSQLFSEKTFACGLYRPWGCLGDQLEMIIEAMGCEKDDLLFGQKQAKVDFRWLDEGFLGRRQGESIKHQKRNLPMWFLGHFGCNYASNIDLKNPPKTLF